MNHQLNQGLPVAQVARNLGCSRQTIYNQRKRRETAPRPRRPSKLDPFKAYIRQRLEDFDLPASTLFREIREKGYKGGITILRAYVAQVKDRHVARVVERFETEPGRQAQIDWAHCGTIVIDGRRRRLSLFTVVLGYSRVIWAKFVIGEQRPILFSLLEEAFAALGGIPREILLDNMKQAIDLARTPDRPAVVNPEFQAFADHWGFKVVACPAYWPRAKGKVERAIRYLKESFLEGRTVTGLDDLNAQLRVWLADVANVRVHGTTRVRPVDRLEEDRAGMHSPGGIPPYPNAGMDRRLADHDGRISFRGVRYSVDPSILSGRRTTPVDVSVGTDGKLRIYHHGRLVGQHLLRPKNHPPVDDPQHARKRRELRQRPTGRRTKGSAPRFHQQSDRITTTLPPAPTVIARSLRAYEGVE